MNTEKIFSLLFGDKSEEEQEEFLCFLSEKLGSLYKDYLMDKLKAADSGLDWKTLTIPNAKEAQEYNQTVWMPSVISGKFAGVTVALKEVSGLENTGLLLTVAPDGKSFSITGTPSLEAFRKDGAVAKSTFELKLQYGFEGIGMSSDRPYLEKTASFVINQDPRKLWKNLPVDWEKMPEPKYKKDDTQVEYLTVPALADGTPQKDIVAASQRGRSHAQEGKPRDDHFKLEHLDNGWYVMAVADGAGSAKFSREGSHIACEVAVEYCKSQLVNNEEFEEYVKTYNENKDNSENEARKRVGDCIYKIVGQAAFEAHKAIGQEAAKTKEQSKLYATTLLLAICKKFDFGWFIASFWVGDGAICLYDRRATPHTVKILGVPDEGDFGGQTLFLTMSEIFKDIPSFYQRLRFTIVDDFTALFMMTDGVSDPKFETDVNLNNPDKWDDLWNDLKENGVELTDDNELAKDQLLKWLDFWAPGNHDDRTIAVLYEGEASSNSSSNSDVSELIRGEENISLASDSILHRSLETNEEKNVEKSSTVSDVIRKVTILTDK